MSTVDEFDTEEIIRRVRHARQHHDIDIQQLRDWKKDVSDHMSSLRLLAPMLLDEINYLKAQRRGRAPVPPPAPAHVPVESENEEEEDESEPEPSPAPAPVISLVPEPAPAPTLVSTTTIDDLIRNLSNGKQIDALNRLKLRHADDQMYYVNFERTNVTRGTARQKAVVGKFTVLGAMGARGGDRSCYTITISRRAEDVEKTFNCDCPAHRFQRGREYAVCKHICFVLCRVVGYVTRDFFERYQLNDTEIDLILQRMSASRETILQAVERNRTSTAVVPPQGAGAGSETPTIHLMTRNGFLNSTRPVENVECPICFDMVVDDSNRINCPDCKNHVHRECMEIWLTRNKSCVYCRSSKWKHFNICFVQNQVAVINPESDSDSDSD